MRTVTYQSVLTGAFRLAGEDPAAALSKDKLEMGEYLAERLRTAHQYWRWPELLAIEARNFRDPWVAGNYAAAAEVYMAPLDAYYSAAAPCTAADVPGVSTNWVQMTIFSRWVPWAQTGQAQIEAVVGAWTKDPRAYRDAVPLTWEIGAEGVRFSTYAPDTVWIERRLPCPALTYAAEWSAASFAVGMQVYDAAPGATGEIYLANAACTAADVPGVSAKWTKLDVPAWLGDALKRGAYADWLEADGQTDKAEVQAAKFTELLDEQVWQFTKLQGQTGRYTVTLDRQ